MSTGRPSTLGKATFVLVHGGNISTETWNRLTVGDEIHTQDGMMGGRCWDGTGVRFSRAGSKRAGNGCGRKNLALRYPAGWFFQYTDAWSGSGLIRTMPGGHSMETARRLQMGPEKECAHSRE